MPIGPVSPKDMGRAGRGTSSGGSYGKGVSKGKMTAAAKAYPTSNVKVVKPVKAVAVKKRGVAAKKAVDKAGAEGPKKAVKTKQTPAQIAASKRMASKRLDNRMNQLSKRIALNNRTSRFVDGQERTSYELRN